MKSNLLGTKFLCLGLLLSVGLSLLFTTSCSAASLTGNASQSWFGFGDSIKTNNSGYVLQTDWYSGSLTTFSLPSSTPFAPNNLSHAARINITSDMLTNNGKTLRISGTVRLGVYVSSTRSIFGKLSSAYQLFNGNVFGIGVDPDTGVYDMTARVTSVSCYPYPQSDTSAGYTYGSVQCDVNFVAENNDWAPTATGYYWLSWRLNGNSASNGGRGSFWGGFYGTAASNNVLSVRSLNASYSIDFGGSASSDPDNSAVLDQLAQQNNTIIGQNNQIIGGISDVKDQLIQNNQQQHEDAQNQLEESKKQTDFITSDEEPDVDVDSALSGVSGWLPAGPVDSLVTLPAQFLAGVVSAFTGGDSCSPISLPLPFVSSSIELPCMRPILDQLEISLLWNSVGGILSFFVLFDTFKWLYNYVDKALTLNGGDAGDVWGGL